MSPAFVKYTDRKECSLQRRTHAKNQISEIPYDMKNTSKNQ